MFLNRIKNAIRFKIEVFRIQCSNLFSFKLLPEHMGKVYENIALRYATLPKLYSKGRTRRKFYEE